MTSHYTQGPMTTLHAFGSVLGRPLDTCFRALTIFMVTALGSLLMCEVALQIYGARATC